MATKLRACGVHVLRHEARRFVALTFPPADSHSCIPITTGEFSTPVGGLIEQATSESLVNAEWGLNLQICDEVSTHFFV